MPDLSSPHTPISARATRISNGQALHQQATEPSLSPVKHPIPRVRLVVRRPPPMYSHPLQKPPPQQHGGSLDTLLSSFTFRHDAEIAPEALAAELNAELALWRKIDALREKGRLVERCEYEFKGAPPVDAWTTIVTQVERPGPKFVDGREMAANVAGKVRKYWEMENKVEEVRLKVLAKKAMRMVVEQWKKAVYHVREQARLEWEAEERRRGQEHLDAILDQSGQILEVQLQDLARDSRSRSRSVSTYGRDRTPADSDDEATRGSDDETERAQDGSDEELDSAAEDEGISMLVPDMEFESESQVGRSPSSISMEVDVDLHSEGDVLGEGRIVRSTEPDSIFAVAVVNGALEDHPRAEGNGHGTPLLTATPISMDVDEELLDTSTPPVPSTQQNGHLSPSRSSDIGDGAESEATIATATKANDKLVPWTPPFKDTALVEESTIDATPLLITDIASADDEATVPQLNGLPVAETSESLPTPAADYDIQEDEVEEHSSIPYYLRPYAVAPVEWDPQAKVKPPLLLRGTLRPYQQSGLEWLASIHARNLNGILADEMGLGKTIQTIALLAHLACERGIWGPHLIVVPTSVLLNWEMEFKKFLPGFKVLSYHGNTKQRKELRQGWNNKYHFNACITSYTLASRDAHVFKRKRWYYMILDEAHMIKNFKSQRWNTLLMFRSFRRLLLTGTPLQNNLTELWALLQFLMSGTDFANLKEFGEWFANPLERAIELGSIDNETQQRVSKLHQVLRPYLLRRLKRDVEKELPQKYEHIVKCHLSKRQRFLYDEFMSRAETRHDLQSGVYQKIANILMQLRKVVNHPDLFEVRPIVTSFAMQRSAVADFEIKELLVRRRLLAEHDEDKVNLDFLGFNLLGRVGQSRNAALETLRLDGTKHLPMISEEPGEPPPADTRTIAGYKTFRAYQQRAATIARWSQIGYINSLRCSRLPIYSSEILSIAQRFYEPLVPHDVGIRPAKYLSTPEKVRFAIKSYASREEEMAPLVDRFAFATPSVVARDLPSIALSGVPKVLFTGSLAEPEFDASLHRASVKLQIAFPDPSLLQYDCGKLQILANLLRERKAGGHRILIFTQMTRILDILEIFLNFHGYLYLRLDGATKIEDRQYITERFNSDSRVFCFISSSRSGGVGINLTGADTVIFYDSDFNPQMDRQCEDRAHRIGQIRDVHIYRFVSQHTVEEALLRKANQKRSLDDIVIQRGEFDWRTLFVEGAVNDGALTRALGEFEDAEDAQAAQLAAREEMELEDEDAQDFEAEARIAQQAGVVETPVKEVMSVPIGEGAGDGDVVRGGEEGEEGGEGEGEEEEEEGGTIDDYMINFVNADPEYFSTADWNV
ncbi:SNF2 family N-terminal domain-containing protein [Ganoderma leucocontextum]|nr:SNF2 family N-terminal domain-containing protein [Ganoderma leucocontextum]